MRARASVFPAFLLVLALAGESGADDALPEGAAARLGTRRLRLDDIVRSLAYSADGETLVAADGRSVVVLEAAAFREKRRFSCDSKVRAIAVSPDGRFVASGAECREVATGKLLWQGLASGSSVVFSPDGKLLAVSGEVGRIRDAATGKDRLLLVGHGGIDAVAFSPDGTLIATADGEGTVRIRDAATGHARTALEGRRARCLAFSPDGRTLAVGGAGAALVDVATGREVQGFDTSSRLNGRVEAIAVSPRGEVLATTDRGENVLVFEARSSDPVRRIEAGAFAMALSPGGKVLAVGSGRTVRAFDASTGAPIDGEGHRGTIHALVFSRSGELVASGSEDRTLRVWNARDGKQVARIECGRSATPLGFLDDGKSLVALRPQASVLDVATGKELRAFRGFDARSACQALSPDGTLLAAKQDPWGDSVRIWSTSTGRPLRELEHVEGPVRGIALLEGNEEVALAAGASLHFLSVATGDAARKLDLACCADERAATRLSPDGKTVACLTQAGAIFVVDAATLAERRLFVPAKEDAAHALAISPDGSLVASGHADGTVRLWDVHEGRETRRLAGHAGAVTAVAFSPDGKRLASGGQDTTGIVWDLAAVLGRDDLAPPSAAGKSPGPAVLERAR